MADRFWAIPWPMAHDPTPLGGTAATATAGAHERHGPTHAHAHAHHHAHDDGDGAHAHSVDARNFNRVAWAAAITGLFLAVEIIGGVISGSLALLADAAHMASDFASLILALIGFVIARRPADSRRTYGFARVSVLAAFINGLALIAIAVAIFVEAGLRIASPRPVDASTMLWVATAGLFANIAAFVILHGADRDNLNIRGALLHVLGDLLGSVAAITAALIILATGWTPADPLLSGLIGLILLRSAVHLVRDAGHILIEGAPGRIDAVAVARDLSAHVEGVEDVHHAHVWSLDGSTPMMTLHARIPDGASGPEAVARIKSRLRDVHGVGHATVEIEHTPCTEPDCP
jgi:cobalt-zinc-cadmium efflux system protein